MCRYKLHSVKHIRSQKFIPLYIQVKSQSEASLQTAMTIYSDMYLLYIELCVDANYILLNTLDRKNLFSCIFKLSHNRQRLFKRQWQYILICIQQDAKLHSVFISGNCSTCFGWYLHPSSGARTTLSTASGTCQTVTANCRYRGRVGTAVPSLPRFDK